MYGTSRLVRTTWYAGLYEKTLENSITKHYYYINGPDGPIALAMQTGGGTPVIYYLCKDHLGSITGVMESDGDLVEEYNYDAWGKRRNSTDWSYTNVPTATYTQHGFTGHEHLDMFNLINMNGRVYDSEIARFVSPDPIIQDPYNIISYNRYAYCLNNPLKYTDPSGYSYRRFWELFLEEQKGSGQGTQFFNNYPRGWSEYQHSLSEGKWQYYLSSGYIIDGSNPEFGRKGSNLGYWVKTYQSKVNSCQGNIHDLNNPGSAGITLEFFAVPSPIGEGGMTDFGNLNTSLTLGGGIFGALEGLSASQGYWLGKNGKYYTTITGKGPNQYTGSRSGAFKAANQYKLAGRATVIVSVGIGIYSTIEGYQLDGGQFGYNAQMAAFSSAGSIGLGLAGAEAGAALGAAIGVWFGGFGAIPGAVVGGIIGGFGLGVGGGYLGGYLGGSAVNHYYGR